MVIRKVAVILLSCHLVIILSSCHLVFISSCHLVILSFCHLVILLSCYHVTLSSCHLVIMSSYLKKTKCIPYSISLSYDREFLSGRFSDRTFTHLLFCQTPIFLNVLSNMWFCQNIANIVLSKFVEILSNTGGYSLSVLFCQSLQSCLTEQF